MNGIYIWSFPIILWRFSGQSLIPSNRFASMPGNSMQEIHFSLSFFLSPSTIVTIFEYSRVQCSIHWFLFNRSKSDLFIEGICIMNTWVDINHFHIVILNKFYCLDRAQILSKPRMLTLAHSCALSATFTCTINKQIEPRIQNHTKRSPIWIYLFVSLSFFFCPVHSRTPALPHSLNSGMSNHFNV